MAQTGPDDSASPQALQTLVGELLASARASDAARLAALIDNLRLPAHQAWFERAFGTQEGAAQDAKYSRFLEEFEPALSQRFAALATQPGLESEVSRVGLLPDSLESVEEIPPVQAPLTLFAVTLRKPGTDFAPRLAWFVYESGAFRFVGRMRASTAPPMRIRVAAAVQERKLVNRVAPVYPVYAREAGIAGTVRLEAIIKTDGRIDELRVLSGDPNLVAATVAAVQQWRYHPTLLDGEPAEVITLISVLFRLDQ
ncbi:MAG: energy transducer TonB [Acidobacteria bacterium]|nr:energy transducer TonB [Acidobacteriota bacterium]